MAIKEGDGDDDGTLHNPRAPPFTVSESQDLDEVDTHELR
jgi:hypothetical protein